MSRFFDPMGEIHALLDLRSACDRAGLSEDHRRLILALYRGASAEQAAQDFGWTAQNLARIERSLRGDRVSGRALRQHLAAYSKKSYIVLSGNSGISGKVELGDQFVTTIEQLRADLSKEAAKLLRLSERTHSAAVALDEGDTAVVELESASSREAAVAELNETTWNGMESAKRIKAAREKAVAARLSLVAVRAALAAQEKVVAKVEAEFAVRRNETNVARISKPLSEYLAALGVVSQKAVMLDSAVAGTGGVNVDVLFPPGDSRDTLADFMERQEMLRMWASLVSMGQPRAGWEGPMATPYLFRKLA